MADRVNAASLVDGQMVYPLCEGDVCETAFMLIKVRDANGRVGWSFRAPDDYSEEELLGALIAQVDRLRQGILNEWED